jgi:hypothetical protein
MLLWEATSMGDNEIKWGWCTWGASFLACLALFLLETSLTTVGAIIIAGYVSVAGMILLCIILMHIESRS